MSDTENSIDKVKEEDLHEHFRFQVDPGQSPLRIDKWLMLRIEGITRNRIQQAIKQKSILVGGKEVKSNYKVRPNDVIVIVLPEEPRERRSVMPEDLNLDIRYEDEYILIVHKPPGMVVHPGIKNYTGTLVNGLAYHLGQKSEFPLLPGNDPTRPGLVHRIDKDTSGLLVIAKTHNAMAHLAKQFYDHSINREYVALVWGSFDDEKGTLEGNIGRHPKERLKHCVFPDGDSGKVAITHYEVLEDLYYVSLVKCILETGRTHQIRVHMSHEGHPVFSDDRYGGDQIRKGTVFTKYKQFVQNVFKMLPRQALHARSLGFIHPHTKEYVKFESDLPEDISTALDKWRHYVTHKKD